MILNFYSEDIKQYDQNDQDKKKNILFATTDITDYDSFFDGFNSGKVSVKILDNLIDDYLKISLKMSAKGIDQIEIKIESNLTRS